MAKRQYSNEQKQDALEALASGEDLTSVAGRLSIPIGTLSSWKTRQEKAFEIGMLAKQVVLNIPNHKLDDAGGHLVDYICELLTTLKEQVKILSNEEWIKKQSANQLAALHGVLADRAILLLEALAEPPDTTGKTEHLSGADV